MGCLVVVVCELAAPDLAHNQVQEVIDPREPTGSGSRQNQTSHRFDELIVGGAGPRGGRQLAQENRTEKSGCGQRRDGGKQSKQQAKTHDEVKQRNDAINHAGVDAIGPRLDEIQEAVGLSLHVGSNPVLVLFVVRPDGVDLLEGRGCLALPLASNRFALATQARDTVANLFFTTTGIQSRDSLAAQFVLFRARRRSRTSPSRTA